MLQARLQKLNKEIDKIEKEYAHANLKDLSIFADFVELFSPINIQAVVLYKARSGETFNSHHLEAIAKAPDTIIPSSGEISANSCAVTTFIERESKLENRLKEVVDYLEANETSGVIFHGPAKNKPAPKSESSESPESSEDEGVSWAPKGFLNKKK